MTPTDRVVNLVLGEPGEDELIEVARCRICGCTDDMACPEGCYWVEPDLCSACDEGGAS